MVKIAKFVGLDVHKDTISIAWAEGGPLHRPVSGGTVPHDVPRLVKKLLELAPAEHLWVAYEAGPTGYGLARGLLERGINCIVVAPNKVPREPGRRVKTDKRDARDLARALRAGNLTGIALPEVEVEAMRDLVRAREDCVRALRRVRKQLSSFLLRHQRIYREGSTWTVRHRTWLGGQRFSAEPQEVTFRYYLYEIDRLEQARDHLTAEVERLMPSLQLAPLYYALQAMRGVSTVVAATLVCEIGEFTRFPSASRLMSYVGLTPSEHSSGPRVKRGSITKAGNGHVRRALVEAAWSGGRHRPAVSKILKRRQKGLDPGVIDIAWKTQKRLYARYRRMLARGKHKNVTAVAMARELIGFVWAIAQRLASSSGTTGGIPSTPSPPASASQV
jgi:transposase